VIVTCVAPDRFFLVCNAGPRADVVSWLQDHATSGVSLADRTFDFLCLAVQGPRHRAPPALTSVDLSRVKPFSGAVLDFVPPAPWGAAPRAVPPEIEGWGRARAMNPSLTRGGEPIVSDGRTALLATRTGYTGEPGFELFPTAAEGLGVWESILKSGEDLGIRPIGLGARDTLRLEKGYLLSGQDFDGHQTPLEVNSEACEVESRLYRTDVLERQRGSGRLSELVGIRMKDRGIPRHGYRVLLRGKEIGHVTSGTMSPSLRVGIALASVDKSASAIGITLDVDIRGPVSGACREAPVPVMPSLHRSRFTHLSQYLDMNVPVW